MAQSNHDNDTQCEGHIVKEDYFKKIRGSRIPGAQGLRDPVGYYGSRQSDDAAVRIAEQHFKFPYGYYNPARRYLEGSSPGWPVSGGIYTGRGPKGYVRSDERIRNDVTYGLAENVEIYDRNIDVEVRGGIVTLNGTAYSRREKRLAEDLALSVPGVSDVQNRIHIVRSALDR